MEPEAAEYLSSQIEALIAQFNNEEYNENENNGEENEENEEENYEDMQMEEEENLNEAKDSFDDF